MSAKLFYGFVAGITAGAVLGILFAPDKGSETRQKIATKTGDLSDSVKQNFCDLIDSLKDTVQSKISRVKDSFEEQTPGGSAPTVS